ncbi:hypothetical protein F5X98DRAFT_371386 [Xylaria grammica]|nr:hypothetical protein F5X98DRAFT_371386 [Xylaria grammica]
MSDHYAGPGEWPASTSRAANHVADSRLESLSPVQAEREAASTSTQTGATSYFDPSPSYTDLFRLGPRGQYSPFKAWHLPWNLPHRAHQIDPNHTLTPIDPNTQQVVSNDFVASAHQTHAKLRDIKNALDKKTEECDEIREHLQAVVGELNDLKSSKESFVVDDAEMTAKWKGLQYAIKNLSRTHLCNLVPLNQLTRNQVEVLGSVSPLYQQILSTEGQVHLLFQSLIWTVIARKILQRPTTVWGGDLFTAVRTVLNVKWNSMEDRHAWRAQTGQIIQGAGGVSDRRKMYLIRELRNTICPFLPREQLSNDTRELIFRRSTREIIDKAIELAVIFNQSRCEYSVEMVAHGERFESVLMEYNEECEAPRVDLMVSPALVKCGNSQGEHYDRWLVLAKSHVHSFNQTPQEGEDEDESLIDL